MNENFIKVSKKLIFKKVFLFLCIFSLMISISVLGADLKLRVITKKANVRLKPSLSSDILSQVPLGAILESQGKFGNWYKVNLPADESGFVVSGYIYESIVEEVIQKFKEPTIKEEKPQEVAQPITQRPVVREKRSVKTKEWGITGKGVKIGLNSANLHGKDIEYIEYLYEGKLKSKLGFCFGGFITYNINEMFAIQPEILFTMKGAKIKEEYYGDTYKISINLTYLEIPVLAKLTIPTQGNIKPNIFAGPSLAIKLSSKAKAEYAGESEEEDIEDLKGIDFGLIIGIGIDFSLDSLAKEKLSVDLRYTLGLTTISKEEDEDIKNSVISIMVGYYF